MVAVEVRLSPSGQILSETTISAMIVKLLRFNLCAMIMMLIDEMHDDAFSDEHFPDDCTGNCESF